MRRGAGAGGAAFSGDAPQDVGKLAPGRMPSSSAYHQQLQDYQGHLSSTSAPLSLSPPVAQSATIPGISGAMNATGSSAAVASAGLASGPRARAYSRNSCRSHRGAILFMHSQQLRIVLLTMLACIGLMMYAIRVTSDDVSAAAIGAGRDATSVTTPASLVISVTADAGVGGVGGDATQRIVGSNRNQANGGEHSTGYVNYDIPVMGGRHVRSTLDPLWDPKLCMPIPMEETKAVNGPLPSVAEPRVEGEPHKKTNHADNVNGGDYAAVGAREGDNGHANIDFVRNDAPRARMFTDADDRALPVVAHPGEAVVSHEQFLVCLAEHLDVNVATHDQRPLNKSNTIPLIVFPMMVELADHRALMCNMETTIRYVMYVDNGGVPEVGRFLADVENAFGWTGRVAVRRYPWNAGFSAAVNSAIDWALQLPAPEVPFIHVSNNDVRYPPGLLKERIGLFHELTRKDHERIAELAAEVEAESRHPAVLSRYRSGRPLRSKGWAIDGELVTSALLPDRIRYMPHMERQEAFADHTAALFFMDHRDGSSLCLSRLALLTVGYWDENYYPAYSEDIDYFWRVSLLGFQISTTTCRGPQAVHFENALRKILTTNQGDEDDESDRDDGKEMVDDTVEAVTGGREEDRVAAIMVKSASQTRQRTRPDAGEVAAQRLAMPADVVRLGRVPLVMGVPRNGVGVTQSRGKVSAYAKKTSRRIQRYSPRAMKVMKMSARTWGMKPEPTYYRTKWGTNTMDSVPGESRFMEPFLSKCQWTYPGYSIFFWRRWAFYREKRASCHNQADALPLDAWVRDKDYRSAIHCVMQGKPRRLGDVLRRELTLTYKTELTKVFR